MQYRTLGRTGLRLSVIGIGTWQFGGEWGKLFSQDEVDGILDAGSESGINLVDTAECYGDHLSERLIGSYLSRRRREDWIVATKFGHEFHSFMQRSWRCAPADILRQLDDSLRALRCGHIDLYQYHSGRNEDFDRPELWETLQEAQRSGKIRFYGVSIARSVNKHQAERARERGFDFIQVVYNRVERKAETEFLPFAELDGLGVLARVPLASGMLTGKYAPGALFPADDVRATYAQEEVARMIEEAAAIRRSEVPPEQSMAAWALRWCLKNPAVTSVIPGCKSREQVLENAAAG